MPALYSHPPQMPESCAKAKAQILIDRFFPPQLIVDLSADIEVAPEYHHSYHIGKITIYKIRSTILRSISKKSPGKDGISNFIFKPIIDILLPHLYRIFNVCLEIEFCSTHFCASVTIVLRKPGKSDYTTAKAYRPIA